ncbi:MAG: hypothetical protein NDI69_11395 [Bacteriovoracaceae bacterium]|nr:hypothetical protein [Bacteriovoracaceae bacterium]
MGFGLLKHFKDNKSANAQNSVSKHYRHVILGQDLGAVLKLMELRRTLPLESVRLISTRPMNRQMLLENYEFGVSHLRSPLAVENIYRKYHNAKILPQSGEATFYKDGKFHEFSGRAKSMELQMGEDFFIQKGYRIELESFFSPEEWDNFDNILKECSELRIFESIEKTTPQDLVEKKEWLLTYKDFASTTCENLYVSLSPKRFINLVNNKDELTPEMIDVCTAVEVQSAMSVTLKLNKEIYPEEKTIFIPQSMTHEWGHFIVEFESYNHQRKEQLCHVLFLIHEEEPQTEDLGSKIKLMKRVLDRVFNDIEKHITKEYIRFDEEMFISNVKDSAMEQLSFDYPSLHFLGQATPMTGELNNEKFLARVLLN